MSRPRVFLLLLTLALARAHAHGQCPGLLPTFSWQNVGDSIVFTDQTLLSGVSIDAWEWNFGDQSPTAFGPVTWHTYALADIDTVRLTLYSAGCPFSISGVVAHGGVAETCNSSISAGFTYAQPANNQVDFSDVSYTAGQSVVSFWAFGDGIIGLDMSVEHFYGLPGTYDVTHSIITLDTLFQTACTAGQAGTVLVDGNASTCDTSVFLALGVTPIGNMVMLSASVVSLSASVVVDGLNWSYGDGSVYLQAPATTEHIYDYGGQYQVCVQANAFDQDIQEACMAMACETVEMGAFAGIQPIRDAERIAAYPVPFSNDLTISGEAVATGAPWFLTDPMGREVASGKFVRTDRETLHLEMLPPGFYVVRVPAKSGYQFLTVTKHD